MMNGITGKRYNRFKKKWLQEATQYARRKAGPHGKRGYVRHEKHKVDWSFQ